MNTKQIAIIITAGILILGVVSFFMLFGGKNSKMAKQSEATPTPTKAVGFVVVRVLPSGFSPKEVTIKKGMIVRFTNPLEKKVTLKWDGDKQYTKDAVYLKHDIATTVFDTEGTYTFSDDAKATQSGKVVVGE